MNIKKAVFPGSFDPFTRAHQDLVERAMLIFDEIIIGIGYNAKKVGMLTVDEREYLIKGVFAGHSTITVQQYQGLTVDFCKQVDAQFILRGLRNTNDFEFENAIAQNNLILNPEVETIFLMSRSGTAHISSTIVRDVWSNEGDVRDMVSPFVADYLMKKRTR